MNSLTQSAPRDLVPAEPAALQRRAASLRLRLVMIPALVLLLGLAVAIAATLHGARARIKAEIGSGMGLGRSLVAAALPDLEQAVDPGFAMAQLARSLPSSRHVRLILSGPDGVPFAERTPAAAQAEAEERVPRWFGALVNPGHVSETIPVVAKGRRLGQILIIANPTDEIAELWDEFKLFTALFAAIGAAILVLIYWSVGIALRPLRALADGLDELEQGRFDAKIAPIGLVELRRLGERFESLARSLRRVSEDNRLLVERLISMQETERKELAHELHDELGPRLFGIRADVSCILKALDGEAAGSREIGERARSVGALVDSIQKLNRSILERLRPLILDEMGLAEALRQLLLSWRDRYPEMGWTLHLPDEIAPLDERTSLTVYRVVQESVTNAVRHAGASEVEVSLDYLSADGAAAKPSLHLAISDDGRGLPQALRYGFGLLGISERVRGLGGTLRLRQAEPHGAVLEAVIPLEPHKPRR
jgi:two-component system sensor histidine kinase UhpB